MKSTVECDLYNRHGRALVAFAASLVGPSDASDVVHDAAVSLIASGQLSTAENPRALMYRAVAAKAKSMQRSVFRRRKRERLFTESVTYLDPELHPEVVAAVVGLPQQQRACIFLTYWEDLPPKGIADLLGIAEGTVKHHLATARQNLRSVLDDE